MPSTNSAPDCAPRNAAQAMHWIESGGRFRVYESGQYLGALHSREAAETFIGSCLPIAASRNGQDRRAA